MIERKKPGIGITRLWWRSLWSDEEIQVSDEMNEYCEDYRYESKEGDEATMTLKADEEDQS